MLATVTMKKMPVYALELLMPRESVYYCTRPRPLSPGMHVFFVLVAIALGVFSAIVEPGFIRLLALPAFPLVGMFAAAIVYSPVIFVTDRRIVYARRYLKPLSFELDTLIATRVKQTRLERLLGYGELLLLYPHPEDTREGVFLSYTLSKLRDPYSLNTKILYINGRRCRK